MSEENFEVKNEEIEKKLKEIGQMLKTTAPKGMGFTFFLFDYGAKGNMFYISTAERNDMIKAMKEFISKQENQ